jgi:hypothetical protein
MSEENQDLTEVSISIIRSKSAGTDTVVLAGQLIIADALFGARMAGPSALDNEISDQKADAVYDCRKQDCDQQRWSSHCEVKRAEEQGTEQSRDRPVPQIPPSDIASFDRRN